LIAHLSAEGTLSLGWPHNLLPTPSTFLTEVFWPWSQGLANSTFLFHSEEASTRISPQSHSIRILSHMGFFRCMKRLVYRAGTFASHPTQHKNYHIKHRNTNH
jgi:hypothetical protein